MRNYIRISILISNIIYSQSIPSGFGINQSLNSLLDNGYAWDINTVFKPILWQDIENIDISSINDKYLWYLDRSMISNNTMKDLDDLSNAFAISASPGIILTNLPMLDTLENNYGLSIFNYSKYYINEKIIGWIYARLVNSGDFLPHYTGLPRKISRLGLNSGETDLSGLGYFSNKIRIWFGRDRQNWGSLLFDNLILSENSPSFDQGVIEIKLNKVKFRYFHGYLETIAENNNRYISGKVIEYNNENNFLLGFHEVIIYSGNNRNIDFGYLNPISAHLEIELNERNNGKNITGAQNGIWQFSLDYMPIKGLRLSSNFVIDEYAIDNLDSDTLTNKNDFGFQNRIAYSNIFSSFLYTIDLKYVSIGTYTFRHEIGSNNLVSRNSTIGTELGSDIENIQFGLNIITPWKIKFGLKLGIKNNGVNNIKDNLYEPNNYIHGAGFPSGVINETKYFSYDIIYKYKKNITITFTSSMNSEYDKLYDRYHTISINTYLPLFRYY